MASSDPRSNRKQDDFTTLLSEHQTRLFGFAYTLCLNFEDAEELLQQTCTVMWQKFDDFELGTNFLAWGCRIARLESLKAADRRKRQGKLFNEATQGRLAELAAVEATETGSDHFDSLSHCLEKLSPADRQMIESCYGENVPVREFANSICRSPQSVHNSLKRIRIALLQCVQRQVEQGGNR